MGKCIKKMARVVAAEIDLALNNFQEMVTERERGKRIHVAKSI